MIEQNLQGIDVYIMASVPVSFTEKIGIFSLDKITSRGQNINDPRCQSVLDVGLLCLQFKVTEKNLPQQKIDEEISSLLIQVGKKYPWVNCVKRCAF